MDAAVPPAPGLPGIAIDRPMDTSALGSMPNVVRPMPDGPFSGLLQAVEARVAMAEMSIPNTGGQRDTDAEMSGQYTDGTGLTQDFATCQIPPEHRSSQQHPERPPGVHNNQVLSNPHALHLPVKLLREFIEGEILQHIDLVQAAVASNGSLDNFTVEYPDSWQALKALYDKLAYDTTTTDPWKRLGFAMLAGGDPSPTSIAARERSALLLGSLAQQSSWTASDKKLASDFAEKVSEAARQCEDELPGVLRQRRKLKIGKLPLFKELGPQALQLFYHPSLPQDRQALMLTQWSNIFQQSEVSEGVVTTSRNIAALAEKGDEKLWDWCEGKHVTLWAPEDSNALTRCLAALLRRPPDHRPLSTKFIAPVQLLPGMASVNSITDVWWHPLLGDRWAPLMRRCTFTAMPMEMIDTGPIGPRMIRAGLAIFNLQHDGPRIPPQLLMAQNSLLQLPAVPAATLDMQAVDLPKVMALLQAPPYVELLPRHPRRSMLSTSEIPRLCVDILFPSSYTEIYGQLLLQQLRQQGLPWDTYCAKHSIYETAEAKILEISTSNNVHRFWCLCSQLIAISRNKLLVISETSKEQWTATMDQVLQENSTETSLRLKWKASRIGGRTIAIPSATTAALAASRRRGVKKESSLDYLTDVIIQGEVGREDGEVLRLLMTHVCQATGLSLRETDYSQAPRTGEYIHLASQDPAAPPGRLRLLLQDLEAVRRVRAALHGQTLQVGTDRIGIEIANDYLDSASVPGNGQRRQGWPAPAFC